MYVVFMVVQHRPHVVQGSTNDLVRTLAGRVVASELKGVWNLTTDSLPVLAHLRVGHAADSLDPDTECARWRSVRFGGHCLHTKCRR
eukprot:COSAG01_NODE_22306_length_861_cov_2.143045_1_plen_86_part_10